MATRKRPIPIRKTEPDIIEFPKPQYVLSQSDHTTPVDTELRPLPQPEPQTQRLSRNIFVPAIEDRMRELIREEVHKALDGYSSNLYHCLDRSEAEIIEMGEAQFQALMRDVWRSE